MKKRRLLIFLLAFTICLIPFLSCKSVKAATDEPAKAYYRTPKRFLSTPNTFTATFMAEKDATGFVGIILGNYVGSGGNPVNFGINKNGYIRVNWNASVEIIFDKIDYRTGEWHHIAVVRDKENSSFTLYEDGIFVQTVRGYGVDYDIIGTHTPTIGSDLKTNGEANLFQGQIKDVAVYSEPLTADEVLEENKIEDKTTITKETNSKIMFNWVLDESAQTLIYDKNMTATLQDWSGNENHAYLCTYRHFYKPEDPNWYKVSDDEYTFAFFPDIQYTVSHQPSTMYAQTTWVAEHADDLNLKFVITVGDIINGLLPNWNTTKRAFNILDAADVPYALTLGNHDYDENKLKKENGRDAYHFNRYFKYEDYVNKDWFVEAKDEGAMENVCYTFSGGGVNYLVFALEFGPSDSTLAWATSVIERPEYSDYRVILATHSLVHHSGLFSDENTGSNPNKYGFSKAEGVDVNTGLEIWENFLSKHDNVFMAASGHIVSDSIMRRTDIGDNGNQVLSMLVNAQSIPDVNGKTGASIVLLCTVNEKTQKITFRYYDPAKDLFFCVDNQFEYDFSNVFSRSISSSDCVDVKSYAKTGETVTFNVKDTGLEYNKPIVKDKKGNVIETNESNGVYSFVMPEIGVNIEVTEVSKEHECIYDLKIVDDANLVSEATCTSKAKYYYSCSCGEKGTEFFEHGEELKHTFDCKVTTDNYLASEATCISLAKYYYSCSCGAASNMTFNFGEYKNHTYLHDYDCYDKVCSVCNEMLAKIQSHDWQEVPENDENIRYKCSECNAKMTEAPYEQEEPTKKGCSGSIIGSIGSILLLCSGILIVKYKKKQFDIF